MAPTSTGIVDRDVVSFFTDPAARADPHGFWKALRSHDPVYFSEGLGQWIVTGYPEAHAVFQHASREVSYSPKSAPGYDPDNLAGTFREAMYNVHLPRTDPPRHTEVRGAVRRPFSAPAAEHWRRTIRDAARDLIKRPGPGIPFDFMADVARRLPTRISCGLFGLPESDTALYEEYVVGFTRLLEPDPSPDGLAQGCRAGQGFTTYLDSHIERHQAGHGPPCVLDDLLEAEQAGVITRGEMASFILMVMVGGHDTVAGALGNAMWRFWRTPEQWQRVVADPALIESAAEEVLRYENPLHLVAPKYLVDDLAVGGHTVPKGAALRVSLAGANRDPLQFADPDTFNVGRPDARHLGLGFGPHFCLGGALGRVQIQEFLRVLAQLNPVIDIDEGAIDWSRGLVHFGPHTMPMTLS